MYQGQVDLRTFNMLRVMCDLGFITLAHDGEYDEDGKVWVLILEV